MENTKKNKTAGCISVIVLFVLIVVLLSKCMSGGSNSAAVSSSASINFATASLTEANVKAAITKQTVKSKISAVKIDKGNITVSVYDENFSDETGLILQNQPESAAVFHDLFKNKNVKSVTYTVFIPLSDAYGKKSAEQAITSTLEKADADKVADWETFSNELMSQYYSVVEFHLAPESKIGGLHKAWFDVYK